MRSDIYRSLIGIVLFVVALGLAYPLAMTGVAQVVFPRNADGNPDLIAHAYKRGEDPDPRYFQPRPSQTDYAADATAFANLGPNQQELKDLVAERIKAYQALEQPFAGDLPASRIPIDAVTNSGSGVDPHISQANARIQSYRIAKQRGLDRGRVLDLVEDNTDGRFLGLLGEPGVNVVKLNRALDR